METITLGDKRIDIKTSVLEEKATACNMLCCYADELKEGFFPWIDQKHLFLSIKLHVGHVAGTLVPLLKFYFHEEVRKAAISAMSELLRSAKLAIEGQSQVSVFAEVLCAGKDLATEQTAGRMINLLRQLQQTLPPATLASTCVTSEFHCIRAQASGSTKIEGIPEKTDSKDDNLVFVAGATGRVGSRTIRELIKLGFKVRARVRSAERAGLLIKSVEQMKLDDGTSGGSQAVEKLEIVECDLEKPDQIGPALGNASTVICSIGASEKEVFDITGPCRIDYRATKSLIDAATVAKVITSYWLLH
ncbi:uncharacterized protein LOC107637339 [Arachis ipaensis]|uniref:uncharacterized protein LOC107637339 n=1 Tax=Arachis ipaensis TaxID=130454 RepID=UPI000A2B2AAC|nr:uncharacterized protein LOC107637339 [Arachis ipaensis]